MTTKAAVGTRKDHYGDFTVGPLYIPNQTLAVLHYQLAVLHAIESR